MESIEQRLVMNRQSPREDSAIREIEQNEKAMRSCPECRQIGNHSPACRQSVKPAIHFLPPAYDYSHLVSRTGRGGDRVFDAAHFGQLLTNEDRILLRFGMRIGW